MALILSSCITGQDDVGPEWIRRPPVIFGSLVFIGHGYGENITEARTAALDDALSSMSAGAGYDLSQYYLREIVSTDGIAELGTYINSEYSTPSGGGFEYYVAVVTPESSYNSLMSEDYVQMLEREDRIRGYLDSAGERYRANEDTEALDSTLRALAVSLEGPVEDESLNSSSILAMAMEYLGNIELEANDAGVVTAKRSKGIFHPYIVSGKIDASYERFDADGNRERASVTCLTDSRGRFAFYVTDPYTIRDSEVIFSVSLPSDAMRAIELNAPEGFLDGFYRLLNERSIAYRMEGYSAYDADDTVIGVTFYDENGNIVEGGDAYTIIQDVVDDIGAGYLVAKASGDDDEGVYINMLARYPERSHFLLLRIGITDIAETSRGWSVRSDARALLVDRSRPSEAYDQASSAVGMGVTLDEAKANALWRSASIAIGMILSRI